MKIMTFLLATAFFLQSSYPESWPFTMPSQPDGIWKVCNDRMCIVYQCKNGRCGEVGRFKKAAEFDEYIAP